MIYLENLIDLRKNISNEKKIEIMLEKYDKEIAYRYIEGNNQAYLLADKLLIYLKLKFQL